MPALPLFLATLALAGLTCLSLPAQAAQSSDSCAGFIETLPATITTQGTWCLRGDLSTAISSGNAITIATNNVTIDCNHFKLGGLLAGDSSNAMGIRADDRLNATVRHCNIRGFYFGIYFLGGGHLLEDNRLDQNLYMGIYAAGDNNTVRRNAVYDTGGYLDSALVYGIYAHGDVIDNTVDGLFATANETYPYGIIILGDGSVARGNHVRGLVVWVGEAIGIFAEGPNITVDGNRISASATTGGIGIWGVGGSTSCSNNTVINFATAYSSCEASIDNVAL